jgi:hydrogenase nickel incorporation protein HypB
MCIACGCIDSRTVHIDERILEQNAATARHNRDLFQEMGVLALNLMGSPGSGKTALIEATVRAARGLKLAVVSGDLASDRDGERLRRAGIPARTITMGNACHLDAALLHEALHDFAFRGLDVFIVENLGNLVCPAIYDLGQTVNVVAVSVTEGEDRPLKYPAMFHAADLVLLTKIDLLPALPEVRIEAFAHALARVSPVPRLLPVSARSGEGIDRWIAWLVAWRCVARAELAPAQAGPR